MVSYQRTASAALVAAVLASGCSDGDSGANRATGLANAPNAPRAPRAPNAPPKPVREFRAAWVATVANIDWPSKPGLPVAQQQREAIAILDRLVDLHMNAVVLQVRPHADALYDSALEPWSAYLTGSQGTPPDPFYDPLTYWVDAAHERGLQLHAWFNPYRANHPSHPGEISAKSVIRTHPDLVVKLGNKGYRWLEPTLPEVQDRTAAAVLDVVRRYDVDGVHLDDYFYPYPSYNDGKDFPDERSWQDYRKGGGHLSRGDWRRSAVDALIERLYREIKKAKPWVEFGISPFGIWRPEHPAGIQGLDQHDVLYADARRWLNEGWVDYYSPQLYWPIAQLPQSFPVLLGWWQRENTHGRHLWPGTSIARTRGKTGATELTNQIMITRGMLPSSPGMCMFSMKWLQRSDEVTAQLRRGPFAQPALMPASPWLDGEAPTAPIVAIDEPGTRVTWEPRGSEPAFLWLVQVERDGRWSSNILAHGQRQFSLGKSPERATRVAVSAVDRSRNCSAPAIAPLQRR